MKITFVPAQGTNANLHPLHPCNCNEIFVTSPVSPPACNSLSFPWKKCSFICFFAVFSLLAAHLSQFVPVFHFIWLLFCPWAMDSIQDPPIQNVAVLPLRYPDWRMIDELVYIFYSSSAFHLRPFTITTKHMGSNPTLSTGSTHHRDISGPRPCATPTLPPIHPPTSHHITASD